MHGTWGFRLSRSGLLFLSWEVGKTPSILIHNGQSTLFSRCKREDKSGLRRLCLRGILVERNLSQRRRRANQDEYNS
jgi:hypothetical protein